MAVGNHPYGGIQKHRGITRGTRADPHPIQAMPRFLITPKPQLIQRRRRLRHTYTWYMMPSFPPSECCQFSAGSPSSDAVTWNDYGHPERRLDQPGLRSIVFEADFAVQHAHISDILSRPVLCEGLLLLSLGDSHTGAGAALRNGAVVALARACPNLRVLILDGAIFVSDRALLSSCAACKHLEMVRVTGTTHLRGSIGRFALEALTTDSLREPDLWALAPRLRVLALLDQCVSEEHIKPLSKVRPELEIWEGAADAGPWTTWICEKKVTRSTGPGKTDVRPFDEVAAWYKEELGRERFSVDDWAARNSVDNLSEDDWKKLSS